MDKQAVKNAITEMVNSMYRIQSEKDLQKAIVQRMKDEQGMEREDVKEFKAMAKFAYKMDLATKKAELEAIEAKMAEYGIED